MHSLSIKALPRAKSCPIRWLTPFLMFTSRIFEPIANITRPEWLYEALKHLFAYLIEIKVLQPPKPRQIKKSYSWILNPYLKYLHDECELHQVTIERARRHIESFLEELQQ